MLKKIYFNNKENECANFVVFANATDGKLYEEATFTNQVKQADLERIFAIGKLLINLGEDAGLAIPVKVVANKAYTMNSATVETVTTVSMVEWAALATPVAE